MRRAPSPTACVTLLRPTTPSQDQRIGAGRIMARHHVHVVAGRRTHVIDDSCNLYARGRALCCCCCCCCRIDFRIGLRRRI